MELNDTVTAQVDCTACGNCCKTLMINITEEEANAVADHLDHTRAVFDEQYVEKGSAGMMILNTIPCHFLKHNKCSIYDHRFAGCREFPGLQLPFFTERLFTIFMHYGRCPIIFNVVEHMKIRLDFYSADHS